jgi:hypothetical protein
MRSCYGTVPRASLTQGLSLDVGKTRVSGSQSLEKTLNAHRRLRDRVREGAKADATSPLGFVFR